MNAIEVYHAGIAAVSAPLCHIGRDNLDFGKGFYITTLRRQACTWVVRQTRLNHAATPLVNVYAFQRDAYMAEARCKVFAQYNREWLHFVVANRQGRNPANNYDYIEGGVADDRVINTIELFMLGYIDETMALARLSEHQPNNQICLRNQMLLDKYLHYERTE